MIPSPRATSDRRRSELKASMPMRKERCVCSKRRWITLRKPQPSWLKIHGNGDRSCSVAGEGNFSDGEAATKSGWMSRASRHCV